MPLIFMLCSILIPELVSVDLLLQATSPNNLNSFTFSFYKTSTWSWWKMIKFPSCYHPFPLAPRTPQNCSHSCLNRLKNESHVSQSGLIKYTQSISLTLAVHLQNLPLWFSTFSLRLRSYIIVRVIKEFCFPVAPLLQSLCVEEWTQLIACALVTIAIIIRGFFVTSFTLSLHTCGGSRCHGLRQPLGPQKKRARKVHRPLDYGLADTAAVCATSLKLSSASQHIAEVHDIMGYMCSFCQRQSLQASK